MRIVFAGLFLLFLATFAPPRLYVAPSLPKSSLIAFETISRAGEALIGRNAGELHYMGGWSVRSNDPRFGGLSAMAVSDGRVTALSDAGYVIRFAIPLKNRAAKVDIRQLAEGPGPSDRKWNRDVEAMAAADSTVWLAFEHRNAIWRYDLRSWRAQAGAAPRAMRDWQGNGGGEAMLRLRDGRFMVFSEEKRSSGGTTEVLLFPSDPSTKGAEPLRLRYRAPEGYEIVDAAMLSDGRCVFLNRRFSIFEGLSAKLTLGRLPSLREGKIVTGQEIATLSGPLADGNFEALSVTQENGRDILWVASDNNFMPQLQTYLLKFALAD